MTILRPFLLSLPILIIVAGPAAAESPAPTGKFEAFVELPKDAPYVGEPLRLVLRSAIRARVANDKIVHPALTDFDWQQFGVDAASEELVDGFWMPSLTRVLMIYPLRAGRLTIEPFKRRVIYFDDEGERLETEFVSQPITIDVRPRDGAGDASDFWLPAKSLRISDKWAPEPDKIPFGETATRIVTLEAEGVTADRLPPLPKFRAPGVITFAGPVERQTILTDHGPLARAVYRWRVRPVSTTAAVAPAIRVPWFDISMRVMREAETPERRLAFVDARAALQSGDPKASSGLLAPRPLVAALLAFVSTAAVILLLASKPADGLVATLLETLRRPTKGRARAARGGAGVRRRRLSSRARRPVEERAGSLAARRRARRDRNRAHIGRRGDFRARVQGGAPIVSPRANDRRRPRRAGRE